MNMEIQREPPTINENISDQVQDQFVQILADGSVNQQIIQYISSRSSSQLNFFQTKLVKCLITDPHFVLIVQDVEPIKKNTILQNIKKVYLQSKVPFESLQLKLDDLSEVDLVQVIDYLKNQIQQLKDQKYNIAKDQICFQRAYKNIIQKSELKAIRKIKYIHFQQFAQNLERQLQSQIETKIDNILSQKVYEKIQNFLLQAKDYSMLPQQSKQYSQIHDSQIDKFSYSQSLSQSNFDQQQQTQQTDQMNNQQSLMNIQERLICLPSIIYKSYQLKNYKQLHTKQNIKEKKSIKQNLVCKVKDIIHMINQQIEYNEQVRFSLQIIRWILYFFFALYVLKAILSLFFPMTHYQQKQYFVQSGMTQSQFLKLYPNSK